MIIYNEIDKEITFPKGIGNTPEGYECPVLNEICITENGEFDGYFDKVIVNVPDLNGSYDDGYSQGYSDGNDNGYNVGKAEQKSKLTPITITENGTYNREDGYSKVTVAVPDLNGSYDDGYNDGFTNGKIEGTAEGKQEQKSLMVRTNITRNAVYSREDGYNEVEVNVQPETRVLNVTENGVYLTEVEEDIIPDVTGYFNDGTPFYDYAQLYKEGVYKDNITIDDNTKVEVWWKGDVNQNNKRIFGSGFDNFTIIIDNGTFSAKYWTNDSVVYSNAQSDAWYHFEMSCVNGFWVNGEKVGDLTNISSSVYNTLTLNSCVNTVSFGDYCNNGFYGMLKINNEIYIPTVNGYMNYTNDEILPKVIANVATDNNYLYFNEKINYAEGSLIRRVNVDVQPKINVAKEKIKLGFSNFTEIPEYYDFSNITNMDSMFYQNKNLKDFSKLLLDYPIATSYKNTFSYCEQLTTIPPLDFSETISMETAFANCPNLKTVSLHNTMKVVNMYSIFYDSNNIEKIEPIRADSLKMPSYNGIFYFTTMNKLTDFGGLINLKTSLNSDYNFVRCPNLTYQSCINVLNGLYDFTGNGETPNSEQGVLKVHKNFIDLVGDEISIAINKGWSIISA